MRDIMDNIVFNVNGYSKERLSKALELILGDQKIDGWRINEKSGFVLLWHVKKGKGHKFPVKLDHNEITDIVWKWLKSEDGQNFKPINEWDEDADHDGSNERGWRVYTDEWGHVNEENGLTIDHYSIAAIVPAYCWIGK